METKNGNCISTKIDRQKHENPQGGCGNQKKNKIRQIPNRRKNHELRSGKHGACFSGMVREYKMRTYGQRQMAAMQRRHQKVEIIRTVIWFIASVIIITLITMQ